MQNRLFPFRYLSTSFCMSENWEEKEMPGVARRAKQGLTSSVWIDSAGCVADPVIYWTFASWERIAGAAM